MKTRTSEQMEALREAAKAMRLKHKEQSGQERFVPKLWPQDGVFEAGIAWLNEISSE